MRLKTSIWVSAYLRRCQQEGAFAAVRRKGDDAAGAVFIKVNRLDGTAELYTPAPQTAFEDARPGDRAFTRCFNDAPVDDRVAEERLAQEVTFDTDLWILEVEDRAGRHFLERVVKS